MGKETDFVQESEIYLTDIWKIDRKKGELREDDICDAVDFTILCLQDEI